MSNELEHEQRLGSSKGWHVQGPASGVERTEKTRPEGPVRPGCHHQVALESDVVKSVLQKQLGSFREDEIHRGEIESREPVRKQPRQPELGSGRRSGEGLGENTEALCDQLTVRGREGTIQE